jgi:hypothetical protein
VALHVHPRASRERVGGLHGNALRIHVTEPATDGRANRAVERALARALGVPASGVELVSGTRGRAKRARVAGEPGALADRLLALARATP